MIVDLTGTAAPRATNSDLTGDFGEPIGPNAMASSPSSDGTVAQAGPFGSDKLGRDVFSRMIYGSRISLWTWPYMARIVRGQVLSLRGKEFVEASRSLGASNRRIIFKEILPNLVAPIIVYSTILIPENILFEASLSFLGIGVEAGPPSWGRLKARGGKATGEVATHFLPPGFEEAGGAEGVGVDYLANPRGDMAVAAKYLKAAGYVGQVRGQGGAADDRGHRRSREGAVGGRQGAAREARLGQAAPRAPGRRLHGVLPGSEEGGRRRGGAAWAKDLQDPQSMLEPTFKGANIAPDGGNNNLAELDDPKIDAAMDKAAALQGDERLKGYGEIDKMIVGQAPAVPFDWDKQTDIWSNDVAGAANDFQLLPDFNFTSLK